MDDDYETLRQKNIAERTAVFAEIFKDIKKQKEDLKKYDVENTKRDYSSSDDTENQPPRKRRRRTIAGGDESFRGSKARPDVRRKYNTRSKARNSEGKKPDESDEESDKPKVCDVDQEEEMDNDSDSSDYMPKKRMISVTKSEYDPESIPSVDEITQKMLDNIAERSSMKDYCKIRGTSCHQCRQKTLDTKTVCRSGECVGVRGQFCGPCLKGRYGESAVDALKDPNWACPPCRNLCNCSICRTRNGLPPTGILAPVAHEEGYSSVMDYLQSAETDDT